MIEGLQPYSETTNKGVRTSAVNIPWLTSRPAHWQMIRSKRLFTARTERARPDDEQLSATQAYGVIPQAEFERREGRRVVRITQHLDKRAHVEPDDFVISMRSFQGGLERAWARGCIRSSYVVLKPSPEVRVGYFAHLFKSQDYIRALQATSNFIRDGQDLNMKNFVLVDLPLPPDDEQIAIARFLDHANRKINGFIRTKRKLITLLNEQKQAIIHRAVTRGLNPNAPLKPSGIPWLGDIPKHWEVRRGKYLFSKVDVRSRKGEEELLTVSASDGVVPRSSKRVMMFKAASYVGHKLCWPEDLVINSLWAWARGLGFSRYHGIVSTAYGVYRLRQERRELWSYLNELLRSQAYDWEFHVRSKGIWKSRLQLTDESFLDMLIVLPPIKESEAIVQHVAESTKGLSQATARTEREIALMQEYRTRLTADVVTGKVDVRAAARDLPAAVQESEPATAIDAEEIDEGEEMAAAEP